MFFSVIIPTYNPGQFLPRLLESISHNQCLNDIEVIISDDCSTEKFDDIIEEYSKKLNIRKIVNKEHTGFPREGRQNGANESTGDWICFADQDDYYLNGAFDKVKEIITTKKLTSIVVSNFIIENSTTYEQHIEHGLKGWTHGKFYSKNFWLDEELGYDDIQYCEDINLSTKVSCILIAKKDQYTIIEDPIYVWCKRKDSLSEGTYFINSFPDYIKATLGVILKYLNKYIDGGDNKIISDYNILFIQTFLHMYFYLQSDFFYHEKEKMIAIIQILQPIYDEYKKLFHYTNEYFIQLLSTDLLNLYHSIRDGDFNQIPFIEQIAFKDWINIFFN